MPGMTEEEERGQPELTEMLRAQPALSNMTKGKEQPIMEHAGEFSPSTRSTHWTRAGPAGA